jgi:hypothetical protein
MKHPLQSSRVALVLLREDRGDREWRVTLDGLTKGFLVRCLPGEGGGWWWRQPSGKHGLARTKEAAVLAILA